MARSSILSDGLVRQLVAVGQVDILVGVPTFNNAATVGPVITTLHVGLARHFPRERTVLINVDGGSDDGTLDAVRDAPMADEEMRGSASLRTTHRVSAGHAGLPGGAAGIRTVFAAADLLRARAVMLVDPTVTSMTPDWVGEIARPIWKDEADLVLPVHPRHRFESPLLSQLVRPLIGTAYARRLHSNVVGDFGCSGRFAARHVGHQVWHDEPTVPALNVSLIADAMSDDLRLVQVHLGPCLHARRAAPPALGDLFRQVVGAALASLQRHDATWTSRADVVDVPATGTPAGLGAPVPHADVTSMADRFRSAVRDLSPLLRDIIAPETLARLQAAALPGDGPARIPDSLWVTTVYEFVAAAHRGVMPRDHLIRALIPLYLGRTASYWTEIASVTDEVCMNRLSELEREFERQRPYLVERWTTDGRR